MILCNPNLKNKTKKKAAMVYFACGGKHFFLLTHKYIFVFSLISWDNFHS